MPNPTRQEILEAHEALEELKNVALSAADFCGDTEKFLMWKNEILKALPPKPQPTMAEIEWDDEKHYLAEATSDQFGRVIMLRKGKEGYIEFIVPGEPECGTLVAYTEYLTPTGRRYTLKEIDND